MMCVMVQSLFNGKDLSGWLMDIPAHDKKPELPKSFIVRDGMLVSLGKPSGHLLTDKEYENYRLIAEYRFAGGVQTVHGRRQIVEIWMVQ